MSTQPATFGPASREQAFASCESAASERGRWLAALILALLFHIVCGLGARWVGLGGPATLQASAPEPVSFVFDQAVSASAASQAAVSGERPAPTPPEPKQPSEFSELPVDRTDVRPERPDFLSNVDSRARDRRPGGEDTGLPELKGRGEAPHVGMEPAGQPQPVLPPAGAQASAAGAQASPGGRPARPPAAGPGPGGPPQDGSALDATAQNATAQDAGSAAAADDARRRRASTADSREDLLGRGEGGPATPVLLQRLGTTDIYQEEMDNPGGNVQLFGDVSLSTIKWAYAPWLQHFFREVQRNWRAPYAYYLGVIHGYTLVELEVARDGKLVRLEVLGEEGHSSLREHSIAALRSTAPYQALPEDFPEPSLVLRLKMIYPDHEH